MKKDLNAEVDRYRTEIIRQEEEIKKKEEEIKKKEEEIVTKGSEITELKETNKQLDAVIQSNKDEIQTLNNRLKLANDKQVSSTNNAGDGGEENDTLLSKTGAPASKIEVRHLKHAGHFGNLLNMQDE